MWPSVWVLLIASALVGSVYGVGTIAMSRFNGGSDFIPTHRIPWFTDSVIEYHMDYSLNSDEYNDVVFIGASATLAGMIPHSFERETGLRAYNLGTEIGIGPYGHLEVLKAYLRNHPKPKLVVYTAFPRDIGLDEDPGDSELKYRFFRAYGSAAKADRYSEAISHQRYLREGLMVFSSLAKSGLKHSHESTRGNRPSHRALGPALAKERGYQEYPQAEAIDLSYLGETGSFTISDWYDRGFKEMAALTQGWDIGFMIVFMPVPASGYSIDHEPLTSWAEQFAADYPETVVNGLPLQAYGLDLWANATHLNRSGAEGLTHQVSEQVMGVINRDGASVALR